MSTFQNNKSQNTSISELGEFRLIDHITKPFKSTKKSTIKAIGDDAAVFNFSKDKYHLLSTDMLIEGVHFDLSYCPLKHLGYKAVSVNISDICAMNGVATQITVSIAVSSRFSLESIEELYTGIQAACHRYNVDLVGGDTTSSTKGLIISISIVGEVKKKKIVYRSGAKENDLLVVTGDLGASYLGLQILKREKEIFLENPEVQPDLQGNDYSLQRQLKTEAKVEIIKILDELNIIPTSMIDISDGLLSEILHISKSSNVGVTIYEDKVPIDHTTMNLARELNLNPIICALNGGEDYELLFTINQKEYDKLKKDVDFTIIGHITEKKEGNNFITKDATSHPIIAQGWDPIKNI